MTVSGGQVKVKVRPVVDEDEVERVAEEIARRVSGAILDAIIRDGEQLRQMLRIDGDHRTD